MPLPKPVLGNPCSFCGHSVLSQSCSTCWPDMKNINERLPANKILLTRSELEIALQIYITILPANSEK